MESVAKRFKLGFELAGKGEFERAMKQFASIIRQDPEMSDPLSVTGVSARMCQADCQGELGDWEGAVNTAAPTLALAANIVGHFAYLLQNLGQHEPAAHFYSVGLLLAPDAPDFLHGAGVNKMKLGHLKEALGDLGRAVKLVPRSPEIWYDFGTALSRTGRKEEARSAFRKSLRLDPELFWAYYDLACLDALDGKAAAAFRNLNRAVDCGFDQADHMKADADLAPLRDDPRWARILDRIGIGSSRL